MLPTVNVIFSFILTYGLPMAFAARELWLLSRDEGRGSGDDHKVVAPAPKPLPDCLIPRLRPHTPYDWEHEDDLERKVGRDLELV